MSINKKISWSVENVSEYRSQINAEVQIKEMRNFLQNIFIEVGEILSVLTLKVHLLKNAELSDLDNKQKDYLQDFLSYLRVLQKKTLSADIALNESFRELSASADPLLLSFMREKERTFRLQIASVEELSTEEVFETIEGEFQYVFASSQRCISSLSLLEQKEDFYAVWEEVSLCALSLDFVLHFFEKWLQNKGIFVQ